jgi:hypothetical protein
VLRPDGGAQRLEVQPEPSVRRDLADVPRREPRQHRRLLHGVVHLVRGVEHAAQEILGQPLAPRRGQGDEVRERAAAGQQAQRALRVADDLAQPARDVRFELGQGRSGLPHADVAVEGVGDQVRHRRVEQAAARDVGQVPRAGGVEALRRGAVEDEVQELFVRGAGLGQRL